MTTTTQQRDLLYFSVFGASEEHLAQLSLAIASLHASTSAASASAMDVLVLTDEATLSLVRSRGTRFELPVRFLAIDAPHVPSRLVHRFLIFEVPGLDLRPYGRICYSDTDVLFARSGSAAALFGILDPSSTSTRIHAAPEGTPPACHDDFWYSLQSYTPEEKARVSALQTVNSGVLLFRNDPAVRATFASLVAFYLRFTARNPGHRYMDQSFLNHHGLLHDALDSRLFAQASVVQLVPEEAPPPLPAASVLHFYGMGRRSKSRDMAEYARRHGIALSSTPNLGSRPG